MDKQQKKKRMAAALAVIGGITLLILLLQQLGILNLFGPEEQETVAENYDIEAWRLSPPDWDGDIFTSERYLAKSRTLRYSEDGNDFTTYQFDEYLEKRSQGEGVNFMADYFYAAMCGDHELLNSMHTDYYLEHQGAYEEFPMQKIYDISIVKVKSYVGTSESGAPIQVYLYEVNFRIQSNDGRFVRDRYSDSTVPVFYEIVEDGDTFKVNRTAHLYDNISN